MTAMSMTIGACLLFALGAAIVGATVLSAIRTVVLPRGQPVMLSRVVFRVVRSVFDLRAARVRTYEHRDRVMALYAPVALLTLPLVWLGTVTGGYALMFWAVGERGWGRALETSGSSLLTLGFVRPERLGSVALAFSEATLGVTVLALLLVTYLPSMYGAFSRRELSVTLLEVRAGSPPSAVEMLRRMHTISGLDGLREVFPAWETWFADLAETHTSFPAMSFFRSPLPQHSWITAAGAVLDAAALTVSAVDLPAAAPENPLGVRFPEAETCIRSGYLALRRVADMFFVPYDPDPAPDGPIAIDRSEFDQAFAELAEAGVPLVADRDAAWRAFAGWRVNYDAPLIALAAVTMAPYARWSSDRSIAFRRPRRRRALTPGR